MLGGFVLLLCLRRVASLHRHGIEETLRWARKKEYQGISLSAEKDAIPTPHSIWHGRGPLSSPVGLHYDVAQRVVHVQ